ncbi:MAG: metallophosphoesterase [Candidatus Diapherotrites archaeon]|nr:metallophosphoesterase [Candidatus Diapherotrites archaeon]
MRIALVSDTHLGFAHRTEREGDAFTQFKQAAEMIGRLQPDLVLHPGDFFDEKIPLQETWHEAFEILSMFYKAPASEVKITQYQREGHSTPFLFHGIPVVAIAGTHEYRGRDYKNALQVLQSAGFLACLHASSVEVRKGEEHVVIQGLSGVPEKHARDALVAWNPVPQKGAHNLLVLHQSIEEFLPVDDDMTATIGLKDLPSGFDLCIDGHLHWTSVTDLPQGGSLLVVGSTVLTQAKNLESKKPKGFYIYDTQTRALDFHEIPVQRRLFYHKFSFKNASAEEVLQAVEEAIGQDLKTPLELKPIIRLKLTGTLSTGLSAADVSVESLRDKYAEKALFSLSKHFSMESFKHRMEELRELQKERASVAKIGMALLERNLAQTGFNNAFDVQRVFDLLADKDLDIVIKVLGEMPVGEGLDGAEPKSGVGGV